MRRETDLDAVRGFAILLAMGWHINQPTNNAIVDALFSPGRIFGWAGVDLFFVLSGFLVGRLILTEFKDQGRLDLKTFFIRRILRLWPTLYVFIAFMCVASPSTITSFLPNVMFHVQNYFRTPVATHLWSLAVEEHFYLAFALIIGLISGRKLSPNSVIGVCFAFVIGCPILRSLGSYLGAGAIDLQIQTHYRLDGLALGVALSALWTYYPAVFEKILKQRILNLLVVISGLAFLCVVKKDTTLGTSVGFTVSIVTSAAFLLLAYKSGVEKWARPATAAMAFLGIYSYAMYLWHVPAIKAVHAIADKIGFHEQSAIAIACYIASIASAFVLTKLVEGPTLKLRERLFPRPHTV